MVPASPWPGGGLVIGGRTSRSHRIPVCHSGWPSRLSSKLNLGRVRGDRRYRSGRKPVLRGRQRPTEPLLGLDLPAAGPTRASCRPLRRRPCGWRRSVPRLPGVPSHGRPWGGLERRSDAGDRPSQGGRSRPGSRSRTRQHQGPGRRGGRAGSRKLCPSWHAARHHTAGPASHLNQALRRLDTW